MIPVTDEMREAFERAFEFATSDDEVVINRRAIRAGLAAVIAIVERDHLRPASGPDRCSDCGRTSRNLTPIRDVVDGQTVVVARLGPSCYRRAAARDGGGRQALPIGDAQ